MTSLSIIHHNHVESTQDTAQEYIAQGAKDSFVVWANYQTKGRGKHGRTWHSPQGNIYLTCALTMDHLSHLSDRVIATALAIITGVTTVQIFEPFQPTRGPSMGLKWPNDVMIGSKKMGGILIDMFSFKGRRWAMVGVGINLVSHPDPGTVTTPATDVTSAWSIQIDPAWVVEKLSQRISDESKNIHPSTMPSWVTHWSSLLMGMGQPILIQMGHESIQGIFKGIDQESCHLIVESATGQRKISAGDVFFPELGA